MLSFSNRPCCQAVRGTDGFTLLEVMVAVAVIAIAFVTLIGAQSQSVAIATGSKFDAVASQLGQRQIAELSLLDYNELTRSTGYFGDDFPGFSWKAEVTELSEGDTGIKGSAGMLKAVEVTVQDEQDAAHLYTLKTIVCKKMTAVK